MTIASYIDHTLLKPTALSAEITQLCQEALQYQFAAVCIPPPFVSMAKDACAASVVRVATVIGFPFGYSTASAKFAEAKQAIADGAQELDVVINGISLQGGDEATLKKEMKAIIDLSHEQGVLVKVIIESGMLTDDQIIRCCSKYSGLKADFLKTSTGYAEKGATVEAVSLMRAHLPASVAIKASGGIRTYEFARQLIEAGATRLGCSASISIVQGAPATAGGY